MSNLRNSKLLEQVAGHPLKSALAKMFDIVETFAGDVEFLTLNKDLSAEGRGKARQAKLRAAIRDLRDARAPINELQTKLDTKRKAVAMPKFDQSDLLGFLRRQELRSVLRSMNADQRAMHLNDPSFCDAMLELPALASGLFLAEDFNGPVLAEIQRDRDIVAAAKEKRLAGMFAPQLAEIEEMEKTIAEANMIADIARVDLQGNSGMDSRVFAEFVRPIEAKRNAHWLKKTLDLNGVERTIVLDLTPLSGHPTSRWATPDEIRDGKYYKDHAEYLADRAT
jgi:hypothetical protein